MIRVLLIASRQTVNSLEKLALLLSLVGTLPCSKRIVEDTNNFVSEIILETPSTVLGKSREIWPSIGIIHLSFPVSSKS